jgi:bacteriorhodopsin
MKPVIKFLSYLALALTIVPAFLVLADVVNDATYKTLMLSGTIGWFVTAPFWIFEKKEDEAA